jgi:hypothetical protein
MRQDTDTLLNGEADIVLAAGRPIDNRPQVVNLPYKNRRGAHSPRQSVRVFELLFFHFFNRSAATSTRVNLRSPADTYEVKHWNWDRRVLAPRHGFEPRFTAPKAAVLPLDDRGIFALLNCFRLV